MKRKVGDRVWVACVEHTGPAPFEAAITRLSYFGDHYQVEGWCMWWRSDSFHDTKAAAAEHAQARWESMKKVHADREDNCR